MGRALKFYSSIRIDVRKIESIKKGGEVCANRVRAKIVKNKVAPPFREAEFEITFGKGIDSMSEIIDLGVSFEHIVKSGSWFSLPDGTKIGQGKENAKDFLNSNPLIANDLKSKIKESLNISNDIITSDLNQNKEEETD